MQKIVHFLSFSTLSHEFTPFFNTFRAQSNKFQINNTYSFWYCNMFHVHLIIYILKRQIIYTILKHQNNGSGRKVSNFTVFQQIILACYNPSPYGMSGFRRDNQAKIC